MKRIDLAHAINVSPATITQWITGVTKNYDAVNILRAADVLGVSAHWLLLGTGASVAISKEACTAAEAIDALPSELKQEAFDFLLYKVDRADAQLFASEKMPDYHRMLSKIIEDMKKRSEDKEP